MKGRGSPPLPSRRLDQWLWFARFVKTRSLAAHLCAAGGITVNGEMIKKAHHTVRVGDTVVMPRGPLCRTVRVLGLGLRRGPAPEARLLYEEIATVHRSEFAADWKPLLMGEDDARINYSDELKGRNRSDCD